MDKKQLKNSWPLNVHRWSEYPEINNAVDYIAEEFATLPGTSNRHNKLKLKRHLKMLILDLYVTYTQSPDTWTAYHRNANKFGAGTRMDRLHINYRPFIRAVNGLQELGYITSYNGFIDRLTFRSAMARMKATDKLIALIQGHKIKLQMINNYPSGELLILRDKDGNDLEYEDTPTTLQLRADVTLYNQLLEVSYIDYEEAEGGNYHINKLNKRVRRVFNGSWELGGRYHGGWWQYIPRELRKYIMLNGKPTEEHDYSFLHPAILYAMEGSDLYLDGRDAYNIKIGYPDLALQRNLIKKLMLFALNAGNDVQCLRAIRKEVMDNPADYPPKNWLFPELKRVLAAIKDYHSPIRHHFNTGIGLKLQYMDSLIATDVINHMTQREHIPKRHRIMNTSELQQRVLKIAERIRENRQHEEWPINVSPKPWQCRICGQRQGCSVARV